MEPMQYVSYFQRETKKRERECVRERGGGKKEI